ncbi:ComF family protein [Wenyingzhuangia sp. IMCC45533]
MNLLKDMRDLFVPYRCTHCKEIVNQNKVFLCASCFLELEETSFTNYRNNPLEKLFWGHVDIVKASSIYFYHKNSPIQTLLKSLKYGGLESFGLFAAKNIISNPEFDTFSADIDCITIIPLHPKKQKKRGYNQVEVFGKKIADYTNKPFYKDLLLKIKNTKSQTTQNKELRIENVKNSFTVNPKYNLKNQNILLIDDVLTTGATLISCSKALNKSFDVNISIITIACVV